MVMKTCFFHVFLDCFQASNDAWQEANKKSPEESKLTQIFFCWHTSLWYATQKNKTNIHTYWVVSPLSNSGIGIPGLRTKTIIILVVSVTWQGDNPTHTHHKTHTHRARLLIPCLHVVTLIFTIIIWISWPLLWLASRIFWKRWGEGVVIFAGEIFVADDPMWPWWQFFKRNPCERGFEKKMVKNDVPRCYRGFTIHWCVVPKCVRKNHSDGLTVRPINQPSNPLTALVNAAGNFVLPKKVWKSFRGHWITHAGKIQQCLNGWWFGGFLLEWCSVWVGNIMT